MRTSRSGFTIVEMMVITIIIGILITFAIPTYLRSIERSQCSQAMANLRTLRQAELTYFTAFQEYEGTIANLNDIAGVDFSAMNNVQWTYSILSADADSFVLEAERQHGRYAGDSITLNELDVWGGGYPIANP